MPLNRLTRRLQDIRKKSNERLNQILYEERCIKEQIYFELLYVSAFRSPVYGVKFRAKFEVVLAKTVFADHCEYIFSTELYSTAILSNRATIREGNSTEIDSVFT